MGLTDAERSPDGSIVGFERDLGDGPPQIFVLAADGVARPLTGLAGGAYDPAWSPDGQTIAFSGRPSTGSDFDIYTVNLAGGTPRRMVGTRMDDEHPDWSPDGTRIVFGGGFSDLRSIGQGEIWVASGPNARTPAAHATGFPTGSHRARVVAGGRWIAYRVFEHGYTVNGRPVAAWLWRMRPDGSHRLAIGDGGGYKLMHEPSWSPDGRSIVIERSDWRRRVLKVFLLDPRTGKAIQGRGRRGPSWSLPRTAPNRAGARMGSS